MSFFKIAPHVKDLGPLDDWLRARFLARGTLEHEGPEASEVTGFAAEAVRAALR